MLAMACNQFHARAYQSIFAPPGMVKTIPVSKNDIQRAKNVEDYLNWQTLYEMEEYEGVFDKTLQLLPINGVAIKKLYYSEDKERAVSENISATDLVLPYRTKSLETARRIVHRLWLHYDELKERDEQGLYVDFDKVHKTASKDDETGNRDTADDTVGEEVINTVDEPHLILECHKDYDLGDGRKSYIFTVDYDSQTLLRAVSREFTKGSYTTTLDYFIDYHFIPNPEGWYSFGFGHFLESLINMGNTAFNQIFDSGSMTNKPFGFYGRRAGFKNKKIKIKPGGMFEVEDASQVVFPNLQRVDQVLFQVLGLVQQYAEQFTSTSDYLMGRESRGTKTPTAHGTLAIIEQGLVTFAVMTKRVFRSLRKELRLLMELNQIFLPDTKEYRVLGKAGEFAFPDVKREDFASVQDVLPIGDPSYASKLTRRQEAKELYQIGMSNPLITGTPPDKETGKQAIPPNFRAMHELTKMTFENYDIKNLSKILPDLPESPMNAEDENSMFMQGDYRSPVQGENHQEHLDTHSNFMQSEFFYYMPPEYQAFFPKHILATHAQIYKEVQQKQQLGSQQPVQGITNQQGQGQAGGLDQGLKGIPGLEDVEVG
jgi:hypothetical protein